MLLQTIERSPMTSPLDSKRAPLSTPWFEKKGRKLETPGMK